MILSRGRCGFEAWKCSADALAGCRGASSPDLYASRGGASDLLEQLGRPKDLLCIIVDSEHQTLYIDAIMFLLTSH